MKPEVISQLSETGAFSSALVEQRLSMAFDRFESRIRSVELVLRDLNGPKGGADIQASLQIRLVRGGVLQFSAVQESIESAVSLVADKATQSLARRFDRVRTRRGISMSGV